MKLPKHRKPLFERLRTDPDEANSHARGEITQVAPCHRKIVIQDSSHQPAFSRHTAHKMLRRNKTAIR
jgi:hypothetical protein